VASPAFLSDDEQIAFEEENGYRRKIILTNKRLLYLNKEGFFKSTWKLSSEIPLQNIEKAYVKTDGFLVQMSTVYLKMKNSEDIDLCLELSGGDALGSFFSEDQGTDMAVRTKVVCDRWVNAINQRLNFNVKSKTELLEERVRELEDKLKNRGVNEVT
jgi:hypothetical protein